MRMIRSQCMMLPVRNSMVMSIRFSIKVRNSVFIREKSYKASQKQKKLSNLMRIKNLLKP